MINIENLDVKMGEFTLKDINLSVNQGEYFVILGPTGSGKTVLLESIAGLNPVKQGNISIDGRDITWEKPERRGVSIVYQDQALFPHMSVKNNILFGLKMQKKTPREIASGLYDLVQLLDISDLLQRRPSTLSGGERQKVALARALSARPKVLLLDEPLSALDQETRETVRTELYRIHHTLGNTVVHVTHDFEEAMTLGTRIAILGNGKIHQVGSPEEIFYKPNSEFVARFTMMRNIFTGEVQRLGQKKVFKTGDIEFGVITAQDGDCYAGIRPDNIMLFPVNQPVSDSNNFVGSITRIVDSGLGLQITVKVPPDFCCFVNRRERTSMDLTEGKQVRISFKPESVHVF